MSSPQNTRIEQVAQEGAGDLFARLQPRFGLPKDAGDIAESAKRLMSGEVTLFAAYAGDTVTGYVLYNRTPKYAPFARLGIPEIQDLNVHPDHRQGGIATSLVAACEALARAEKADMIGLGVGLPASYGPAQRLYVKLGYMPDGAGVVYDAQGVEYGASKPNDDDLCLMLVKAL